MVFCGKTYYEKNKKRILFLKELNRLKNREKDLLRKKIYRKLHQNEIKIRFNEYKKKKAIQIRIKDKIYYELNKKKILNNCKVRKKNHTSRRKYELLRRYKLTTVVYDEMFKNQNGRCFICGKKYNQIPKKTLFVDHDYITCKVRGLLCHNCNVGLGMFKDDKNILLSAVNYLEKFEVE
jgi:hypothetical protein